MARSKSAARSPRMATGASSSDLLTEARLVASRQKGEAAIAAAIAGLRSLESAPVYAGAPPLSSGGPQKMLTRNVQRRLAVPHEPGEWIAVRQLGWIDLAQAEEARGQTVLKNLRDMGGELFGQLQNAK